MRLRTKMLLYIVTTSIIIFSIGIGYISMRYKRKALENAKQVANSYTREYANLIKYSLDKDFGVCRGMAQSFLYYSDISKENKISIHNEILKNVLLKNENFIATFLQWDYSKFDTVYKLKHGRQRYIFYKENPNLFQTDTSKNQIDEKIVFLEGIVDTADYNPENPFYLVKNSGNEFIINPYFYSYAKAENMPEDKKISEDAILETTLIIPIYYNNEFYGIAGCDIPLHHFQSIIKQIKPFKQSYAFLLGNNGKIVAHPNSENLGKSIKEILTIDSKNEQIIEKISLGKSFSFQTKNNESKTLTYITFIPIRIGKTTTPWSIAIAVPVDVIMEEANKHFYISIAVGIIGILALIVIIWFISKSITHPLISITNLLKEIAKGKIDKTKQLQINRKDEISEMTKSANILLKGLNRTATFAGQIGEGNIDAKYTLLSPQDDLGQSLIDMRKKLKLSISQIKLAELNIKKSIRYASRIQTAILPSFGIFRESFSDFFIYFIPRDIVSGDFYWGKKINDFIIIAVADCTGHGVPGAFVSMLGISFLNEIVTRTEITKADQVLNELRLLIKNALHQTKRTSENKDGMDISLCAINLKTKLLQYAGAYNSIYLIRNKLNSINDINEIKINTKIRIFSSDLYNFEKPKSLSNKKTDQKLIEILADRQPIGIHIKEEPFKMNEIQLYENDILYLFSDGYADQFGGDDNSKFQKLRFKQLLLSISDKQMPEQIEILAQTFDEWRGNIEQIDDVLVMGVKI